MRDRGSDEVGERRASQQFDRLSSVGDLTAVLCAVLVLTGTLVPFVTPAIAAGDPPEPRLTDVDVPDSVTLGESFEVTVEGRNDGGRGGHYSTISVSSPTFDDPGDGDRVRVTDGSDHAYDTVVSAGETVYTKSGDAVTADYAVAEAGSTGNSYWQGGDARDLSVEFTPEQAGTVVVYVRVTMPDDDDQEAKYTAPEYGDDTDQQGFEVRRYEVEVREEADPTATIEDVRYPSGEFSVGDEVRTEVEVRNTGASDHEFHVGYAVRGEDGEWRDNDASTDESIPLRAGETDTVTVEWTVRDDAPVGEYDVLTKVYTEKSGGDLEDFQDEDSDRDAFRVVSATSPPDLEIDAPTDDPTVGPGERVDFSVDAEDSDGDLDGVEWYVDGDYRDDSYLSGASDSTSWDTTFDDPGTYRVEAVAYDEEREYSEAVSWTVEVRAADPEGDIERVDWPAGEYEPGDVVRTEVDVENTGEAGHEFAVGYSLRGPDGEWHDDDGTTHETVYVPAFDDRTVTVSWRVPEDAPAGEYDGQVALYERVSGDELAGFLDDRSDRNLFRVAPENTAPDLGRESPRDDDVTAEVEESIDFAVDAADTERNLDRVEWYVDGDRVDTEYTSGGSETAELDWTFDESGDYTVSAVAVDTTGAESASLSWDVTVEAVRPEATIRAVDWPTGEYEPGDRVTATVLVENTGLVGHTFHLGYSVRGRDGDWQSNDGTTDEDRYLARGEDDYVDVSWTVPEDAAPGEYDALVAVYRQETTDGLTGRIDDADEGDTFSVVTPRPTTDLDVERLPDGEYTPGETVTTEIDLRNTGDRETIYEVQYRLVGPEGRLVPGADPREISLRPAEEDPITLDRTLPTDAPDGAYDVVVVVTSEYESDRVTVAESDERDAFRIAGADVAVGAVDFDDDRYTAGSVASGTLDLRNPTGTDRRYDLELSVVGPEGRTTEVTVADDDPVTIPADSSVTTDLRWSVADGTPTGTYGIDLSVWPADAAHTDANRLTHVDRERIVEIIDRLDDRAAVGEIRADPRIALVGDTVQTTATVENTGTERRAFTVTTGLRGPSGIVADELERTETVRLRPDETETVEAGFGLPATTAVGDYDVVVTVQEADREITRRVNESAVDVFGDEGQGVTVESVFTDFYARPGESITVGIGVSSGAVPREVAVRYHLRGPTGDVVTPPDAERIVDLDDFDYEHLTVDVPITDAFTSGKYDVIVTVADPGTAVGESPLARQVAEERFTVDAAESGSITLVPTSDFSASVDLRRDGDLVDSSFVDTGDDVTFTGLARGEYTVEYRTVAVFGGGETVTRSVELGEGDDREIELSPERASARGTVEIDGRRLTGATVNISGEPASTNADGAFQFGRDLSEGDHTLLVEYDDRIIHREVVEIDAGQNELDVDIDYVDPYPGDEFDADEFMLGFWCGDFCYGADGNGHANAEYMLGWLIGSINPAFDVRDGLAAAGRGDVVGVGLSLIGLAPYYGDGVSFGGRFVKFVDDATPRQVHQLREMVRQSGLDAKDTILAKLYDGAETRKVLRDEFGVSRSATTRMSTADARTLRRSAGRLRNAGFDDDTIGRFVETNSHQPSKVAEFGDAARDYAKAAGQSPNDVDTVRIASNADMLEAVWLSRVADAEQATVAGKWDYSSLEPGETYVTSNVKLESTAGETVGELDVVVFEVADDGGVRVTKAYEVGSGKLSNKPDRQLQTALENAKDTGSSTHGYLDADAFGRQSTDEMHEGYVGLTDEYDYDLARQATPDPGSPTYPLTEFNDMSRDLDLQVEGKLIDSQSFTTPALLSPGERSQSTTRPMPTRLMTRGTVDA
ncbi:Ig-like domain-containing protein [Salinirubrum litoreum]|uniref:Ig-like domain-containing protein n=1 Tax=Salinirubrum litoreum TaxID=1126234 RepID=A0ABD5RFW6_9EURY|nr:Ig-like domain-containing protein [Salinirubrum litoreum]